jgi:hypothetical protein
MCRRQSTDEVLMIPVEQRVHRILRELKHFYYGNPYDLMIVKELRCPDDKWIGCYINDYDKLTNSLVITDKSLYLLNSSSQFKIYYKDIDTIKREPEEKQETTHLVVNGQYAVPVFGREGRLMEIYEFLRFLTRVSGDSKKAYA